eukprot:TRINITY_DN24443_c0_g1_i1.p1 TRINITY_DN24443_c0_g1~~TRINITY_DN24443_c0_g1_i1.p1  ORF type:complete len:840 (+),score=114.26 TRINITY_DN24443_c0_g1_i1:44-2563(+)
MAVPVSNGELASSGSAAPAMNRQVAGLVRAVSTTSTSGEDRPPVCSWRFIGANGPAPSKRDCHTAVLYKENGYETMYVFGGWNDSLQLADLYSFCFATSTWRLIPMKGTLPEPREGHSAVVYRTLMIVFGGKNEKTSFSDCHSFSFIDATWRTMYHNRMSLSSTSSLLGPLAPGPAGQCENSRSSSGCSDGTAFQPLLDPPSPRFYHSAVVSRDRMYIFGGCDENSSFGDLFTFELEAQRWWRVLATGDVPSDRYCHSAVVYGDFMYVFGGCEDDNNYGDLYEFHFDTNIWKQVDVRGSVPPSPRYGHACCVDEACNMMILYGGCVESEKYDDVAIFCFDDRQWLIPRPEASGLRVAGHTCVLQDGRLYSFGGCSDDDSLNDVYELSLEQTWLEQRRQMCGQVYPPLGGETLSEGLDEDEHGSDLSCCGAEDEEDEEDEELLEEELEEEEETEETSSQEHDTGPPPQQIPPSEPLWNSKESVEDSSVGNSGSLQRANSGNENSTVGSDSTRSNRASFGPPAAAAPQPSSNVLTGQRGAALSFATAAPALRPVQEESLSSQCSTESHPASLSGGEIPNQSPSAIDRRFFTALPEPQPQQTVPHVHAQAPLASPTQNETLQPAPLEQPLPLGSDKPPEPATGTTAAAGYALNPADTHPFPTVAAPFHTAPPMSALHCPYMHHAPHLPPLFPLATQPPAIDADHLCLDLQRQLRAHYTQVQAQMTSLQARTEEEQIAFEHRVSQTIRAQLAPQQLLLQQLAASVRELHHQVSQLAANQSMAMQQPSGFAGYCARCHQAPAYWPAQPHQPVYTPQFVGARNEGPPGATPPPPPPSNEATRPNR